MQINANYVSVKSTIIPTAKFSIYIRNVFYGWYMHETGFEVRCKSLFEMWHSCN
jgi:hypothetical protein